MIRRYSAKPSRRGVALVAFVAALLVIGTMSLWVLHLTASGNASLTAHFFSSGAFYAAESGLEMSLVESNGNQSTGAPPGNTDSDLAQGSISDNGIAADDPAIATGAWFVTKVSDSPLTYRATGRPASSAPPWSGYRRVLEVQAE